MNSLSCPACSATEVGPYGHNPSGTRRMRCKICRKIWTIEPVNRALSPETEAAIVRSLAERTSQRGIARVFKVSRDTIRAIRKKTPIESNSTD